MTDNELARELSDLAIGRISFFESIGSTNDEALRWAREGAPHLSLVVADEQTAGRGRLNRRWFTPPGSALAFSLVLRPEFLRSIGGAEGRAGKVEVYPRLTAAGALAVATALEDRYGIEVQIKWPNDVLVGGRKLSGVLVEADWLGQELTAAVIGIGINVARESEPPEAGLLFPATSVEVVTGDPVDRWGLLRSVIESLVEWLTRLDGSGFLYSWEERLAYRGKQVRVLQDGGTVREGQLLGLDESGALRLRLRTGEEVTVQVGDVRLRLADVDSHEK